MVYISRTKTPLTGLRSILRETLNEANPPPALRELWSRLVLMLQYVANPGIVRISFCIHVRRHHQAGRLVCRRSEHSLHNTRGWRSVARHPVFEAYVWIGGQYDEFSPTVPHQFCLCLTSLPWDLAPTFACRGLEVTRPCKGCLVKERSGGAVHELETGSVIGLALSGFAFALGLSVLHFLQNHLERD
jgi:hypothetical protein